MPAQPSIPMFKRKAFESSIRLIPVHNLTLML